MANISRRILKERRDKDENLRDGRAAEGKQKIGGFVGD